MEAGAVTLMGTQLTRQVPKPGRHADTPEVMEQSGLAQLPSRVRTNTEHLGGLARSLGDALGVEKLVPDRSGLVVEVVEEPACLLEQSGNERRVELAPGSGAKLGQGTTAALTRAEQFGDVRHLNDAGDNRQLLARFPLWAASPVPTLESVRRHRADLQRYWQQRAQAFGRVALGRLVALSCERALCRKPVQRPRPVLGRCRGGESESDDRRCLVLLAEIDLGQHGPQCHIVAGSIAMCLLDCETGATDVAKQGTKDDVRHELVIADGSPTLGSGWKMSINAAVSTNGRKRTTRPSRTVLW